MAHTIHGSRQLDGMNHPKGGSADLIEREPGELKRAKFSSAFSADEGMPRPAPKAAEPMKVRPGTAASFPQGA